MAGFKNEIVYGTNVDFSGNAHVTAQMTQDGQLLIGSATPPYITANTLTAGAGVSITNGAGSITIGLTGGGVSIDSVAVQTGTSPIAPNGAGLITINGAVVSSGTNPVRTHGTAASTMAVEVQTSQALAAADATKIGLSNFDSAVFTVDANGFVSAASNANILVTTYSSAVSTTWTANARTKVVEVFGWGAGGGGGSGRADAGGAAAGGGGGGAGGVFYFKGPVSFFSGTVTVVVGSGGAGGLAQSTDGTNGNIGNAGSASTQFGNLLATPGNGGAAGTTTAVAGGTNGLSQFLSNVYTTAASTSSGNGSNTIGAAPSQSSGTSANVPPMCGMGGGGGSGADSGTQRQAGAGGKVVDVLGNTILAGGAGGLESTGINGSNGISALTAVGRICGGSGGGGGGGYSVGAGGATAGGNGGNGINYGAGGGGGGGGLSTVANSGAGGNGADGALIIIEYF